MADCMDIISSLPPEIAHHIIAFLPVISMAATACVSKQWDSVLEDDTLWKKSFMRLWIRVSAVQTHSTQWKQLAIHHKGDFYDDIQKAVDSLQENGTVMLRGGLPYESYAVVAKSGIHIRGEVGGHPVVLRSSHDRALHFMGSHNCAISHITVDRYTKAKGSLSAILIKNSNNFHIHDIDLTNACGPCLFVDVCNNGTIENIYVHDGDEHDGIELFKNCNNTTIANNKVSTNKRGIFLGELCHNTIMRNNTIQYNGGNGIDIFKSNNVEIEGNTISNNSGSGVMAARSNISASNNIMEGNTNPFHFDICTGMVVNNRFSGSIVSTESTMVIENNEVNGVESNPIH